MDRDKDKSRDKKKAKRPNQDQFRLIRLVYLRIWELTPDVIQMTQIQQLNLGKSVLHVLLKHLTINWGLVLPKKKRVSCLIYFIIWSVRLLEGFYGNWEQKRLKRWDWCLFKTVRLLKLMIQSNRLLGLWIS